MNQLLKCCVTLIALITYEYCFALDIVKLLQPPHEIDTRIAYKNELIELVMEQTKSEFGEYKILTISSHMVRERATNELIKGELLNVFMSPVDPALEKDSIPIHIPVRKGILSYRLLLIHKKDKERFQNITTADKLKELVAGLQQEWITTKLMSASGYNILSVNNYDSLFKMLNAGRFDYLPRGVHEIYDELSARQQSLPNLIVEPHLMLLMPQVTYTYVSPHEKRLAKRIEAGLHKIIANGELDKLFNRYYADDLERANLSSRTAIEIETPDTHRFSHGGFIYQ